MLYVAIAIVAIVLVAVILDRVIMRTTTERINLDRLDHGDYLFDDLRPSDKQAMQRATTLKKRQRLSKQAKAQKRDANGRFA